MVEDNYTLISNISRNTMYNFYSNYILKNIKKFSLIQIQFFMNKVIMFHDL